MPRNMKANLTTLLAFLLIGFCAIFSYLNWHRYWDEKESESRYFMSDRNGLIVRLDKRDGELVIVNSEGVKRYDNQEIARLLRAEESVRGAIEMPRSYLGNGLWIEGSYKWRSGQLLYRVDYGPFSEEISSAIQASDTVTLSFSDSDSFRVVQTDFPIRSGLRTVDRAGIAKSWSFEGSVPCSEEQSEEISFCAFSWRFSNALLEAIRP